MTKIVFDNKGKPQWVPVVDVYRSYSTLTQPFTQADLDWFRKPIRE